MLISSEQIRKRNSYKEWKKLYEELFSKYVKDKKEAERVLMDIWGFIDGKSRFGYARTSYYAKQSIKQLIEDLNFPKKR